MVLGPQLREEPIARKEAVTIGAAQELGFNFERLKRAMGDAEDIH